MGEKKVEVIVTADASKAVAASESTAGALKKSEEAAAAASASVENIPDAEVKITADATQVVQEASKATQAIKSTAASAAKDASASKFSGFINGINNIKNKWNGLKQAMEGSPIAQALTPIGAAMAIVNSAVTIGRNLMERYHKSLQEVADEAKRSTEQLKYMNSIREQQRQQDAESMTRLQALSSVEKMSNAQKSEAATLVDRLNRSYGDLGISIDRAAGKISGLDLAQTRMLTRQRDQKLKELQSIYKGMAGQREALDSVVDNAGINVGFGYHIGGAETINNAQNQMAALDDQMRDTMQKIAELKKNDPAKERQLSADAEIASAEELLKIQQLKSAGEEDEAKYLEFMINLRGKNLDLTQEERDRLYEITTQIEQEKRMLADATAAREESLRIEQERTKYMKDQLELSDQELAVLNLRLQGAEEEANFLEFCNAKRAQGKELDEEQLKLLYKRQQQAEKMKESYQIKISSEKTMSENQKNLELEIHLQELKNAGLEEEAERLKIISDLEKQKIKPTTEYVESMLAGYKKLRELQKSTSSAYRVSRSIESDSLSQIGLYNYASSGVSSLDRERNDILSDIRDKISGIKPVESSKYILR